MAPNPLGPHTYTCAKNVHGIYFTKCISYFRKMLRGSEYTRVLNMPGFWMYQGHEYASGSEYTRSLNKPGFWIYHSSEYASGSELHRVTQGSEYA